MKKSNCKIFLLIGIIWVIVFSTISIITMPCSRGDCDPGQSVLVSIIIVLLLFDLPGFILIGIAIAKWNSEEETKDERKAKLQALKRGKVKVELKGKI